MHPLTQLWNQVKEFHVAFEHPNNEKPTLQPEDRAVARSGWLKEEADELVEAKTIYEQADAYLDSIYFAIGGLVELGVDPGNLWDIVHTANMAKLWPDGVHRRPEDGKVIKPPSWEDPEPYLRAEVERQQNG